MSSIQPRFSEGLYVNNLSVQGTRPIICIGPSNLGYAFLPTESGILKGVCARRRPDPDQPLRLVSDLAIFFDKEKTQFDQPHLRLESVEVSIQELPAGTDIVIGENNWTRLRNTRCWRPLPNGVETLQWNGGDYWRIPTWSVGFYLPYSDRWPFTPQQLTVEKGRLLIRRDVEQVCIVSKQWLTAIGRNGSMASYLIVTDSFTCLFPDKP